MHTKPVPQPPIRLLLTTLTLMMAPACGLLEEPEEGAPAPVDEPNPMTGAATMAVFPTASSSGTGTGSGTAGSDGADSTGVFPDIGMGVLFSGELAEGDGGWDLPMSCALRFFVGDQLDPVNGVSTEWEAEVLLEIDAFPYLYSIGNDEVPATVANGSMGWVGIRCDFDGDGMNDNVGGFFPQLPAQQITLPRDDIDMTVTFL